MVKLGTGNLGPAISITNGTVERVSVRSETRAISVTGSTVRDSTFEGTATTAGPVSVSAGAATFENGDGRGPRRRDRRGRRTWAATLHNTIAHNPDGPDLGGNGTITATSSNFADLTAGGSKPAAGSGDNQTALPIFVDFANGDLHQAAGSPTRDAGTGTPDTQRRDLDGEARVGHGSRHRRGRIRRARHLGSGHHAEPDPDGSERRQWVVHGRRECDWTVTNPQSRSRQTRSASTIISADTAPEGTTVTCAATSAAVPVHSP